MQDERSINLVTELNHRNRLALVHEAIGIKDNLVECELTVHRRPFDVELTFTNLSKNHKQRLTVMKVSVSQSRCVDA